MESSSTTLIDDNKVRTQYGYDDGGRKIWQCSRTNDGAGRTIVEYSSVLDKAGNRISESIIEPYDSIPAFVPGCTSYTYDDNNRLLLADSCEFTYDNNGNTLSKGQRTYTYDITNRLTSVNGDYNATYTYDGLGNRRSVTHNGITTKFVVDLLDNSNVIMTYDSTGTRLHTYYYGLNGLINQDGLHFYISNPRGDIVTVSNWNLSTSAKFQYDEFGTILQKENSINTPFCFLGKYGCMTDTSDLVYLRARYYDPTIGRFLTEDPLWSTNRYPYGDNNPISRIDPTGMFAESYIAKEIFGGILKEAAIELSRLEMGIELSTVASSLPGSASAVSSFSESAIGVISSSSQDLSPMMADMKLVADLATNVDASSISSAASAIGTAGTAATAASTSASAIAGAVAVAAAGAAICGFLFYHTIVKNDMDDVLDSWAKKFRDTWNRHRAMKGKSYSTKPTFFDPHPNTYDRQGNVYNYYL
jgi:RHS repeat-associated protein